ncbi:MAG: M50 family metallopeptidase, partial [Patescibacteria group bacterium]
VGAGVAMNLLLAIFIFYVFLFLSNFKVLVPKLADYKFISPTKTTIIISYVQDPSPASAAKLVPGDVLLQADGKSFEKISDFQKYTRERASQGLNLNLKITDFLLEEAKMATVAPRKNPPEGQGPLGVGIGEAIIVNYPTFGWKMVSGVAFSADMTAYNVVTLKSFISSAAKTGNAEPLRDAVAGPVGMVSIIGGILGLPGKAMILSLLNITALISLSLMFMNILPIPAVDGGRMVFLLIEAITQKKLPAKYENFVNQAGFMLLLGLMVVIMFNDISKIVAPWLLKK